MDGKEVKKAPSGDALDNMERLRMNSVECKLVWKDLDYFIPQGNSLKKVGLARCIPGLEASSKQILRQICGYAEPGKFLAIIGPSGAGKTTLLNILCRRMKAGYSKGDFTLNGVSLSKRGQTNRYTKIIGYVMQQDNLLPFLTVQETLLYSGMLTLPRSLSVSVKLNRIMEVMHELGLSKVAHQFVGDDLVRGISGGEKKRLSIGIELLRNPSVLFLDEPTSGLDAKNALRLCESLAHLAHKYRYTVITTIHQPRAQIFDQFDLLLILAGGGKQIYFGPAKDTLDYFAAEGFHCPMHENPADYYIDVVTLDYKDQEFEAESRERVDKLNRQWTDFSPLKTMDPYEEPSGGQKDLKKQSRVKGATWPTQVFWVLYRGTLNELRNRSLIISRLIQNLILALLLGFIYFQIDNDQSTIADRNGIIFFIVIEASFNEILPAVASFGGQRAVFFRERDSKAYAISAYWMGRQLSVLFFQLAYPAFFLVIIYFLIGLQTVWFKFFIYFATLELVSLICSSAGMILGTVLPPMAAAALSPLYIIISMIFSGFLVNLENIPPALRWIQWISYGKYAFDNLVRNEFNGLVLRCTKQQLVGVEQVCPITRGEQVVENLNLTGLPFYANLLVLCGFLVLFRLVLLVALKRARPTGQ